MSQIPKRQLGENGPLIPRLGFGAMGISAFYGKPDPDSERFTVLDKCLELGETFWDSADIYQDSEDLIGKWFKRTGKRDEIFLATKFANVIENGKMVSRSDPEYVKQACEKSLKRLGIETIDLYYCHRVDRKTPIELTVKAMAELVKEGKVKYLGLSEVSAETLRRAHAVHRIACVQMEYSPWQLDIEYPETKLLQSCRELGVAVVAYSPLGRGFLTGQYKSRDDFEEGDFRRNSPRFSNENFPKNLKLVEQFQEIAQRKNCTAGQLALAWLLAQGDDIFPIPGTKKIKYLEENVASCTVKLSAGEVKEIRDAIEKTEVHGSRYPESMSGALFGDTPPLKSQ
jgi:aryl-alcohol dehydrogenase-like predicted oxidoreductase